MNGPELEEEFRFHPVRKWRADFAHVDSRTLIEVEGGVWNKGRHVRPEGFMKDAEKYLEAGLLGWTVFRLVKEQLDPETLSRISDFLSERSPDAIMDLL